MTAESSAYVMFKNARCATSCFASAALRSAIAASFAAMMASL